MNSLKQINTAMILAAGFGTRMEELTTRMPKALLPLGHYTMIDFNIQKLRKAGIEKIIINLHHLRDKIRSHLKKYPVDNVEIIFSEEKNILGTGGGIARAEKYFADSPVLIVNSDIISDLSLSHFIENFYRKEALASLAILPSHNYLDYSLVIHDQNNILKGFQPRGKKPDRVKSTAIYMGYQILTLQARAYLHPTFSSVIKDFYIPALKERQLITTYNHSGNWIDIGTKKGYFHTLAKIETGEINLDSLL